MHSRGIAARSREAAGWWQKNTAPLPNTEASGESAIEKQKREAALTMPA
jgi:hypothetical protein